MKTKIYFFCGPPKTATTWFYKYFNKHSEVKIIGGKDNYFYRKDNWLLSLSKYNLTMISMIFDHSLLLRGFHNKIAECNGCGIIIVRNPIDLFCSGVMQQIKDGTISRSSVESSSYLNHPAIVQNINNCKYSLFLKPFLDLKINFFLIDYNEFNKNPKSVLLKLCNMLKINYEQHDSYLVNSMKISRFPKFIHFIRLFIRPLFFKMNLGFFWSAIKLSFITKLFYRELNKNDLILKEKIYQDATRLFSLKDYNTLKNNYSKYFI